MATAYHNLSSYDADTMPDASGMKVAIAAAEWNAEITDTLLKGAVDTLLRNGVKEENIYVARVPGTVELTFASQQMAEFYQPDAVIAIGCVVRGDTPHFDYVCAEASKGVAHVGLETGVPVAFGVLTTENIEQAVERAGTKAGNKGVDAAMTAIEMVNLLKNI